MIQCLLRIAEMRIKYQNRFSQILVISNVVLLIFSILWLIFGLKFTGTDLFEHNSNTFNWAFAGLMGFMIAFFCISIVMGIFGIKISTMASPSKWVVGVYGLFILTIVCIPSII